MEPIRLFDLAAQQARYLATSQTVIANNVANANTPGYQAKSVQPFAEVLDKTQLDLASTNGAHLGLSATERQAATVGGEEEPWEVSDSGNSVSLEQELIKAGDVNRGFSLNTQLVKAFHSMLMSSVKG